MIDEQQHIAGARPVRDPLLKAVLRDLLMTTAGFLLVVAAVVLTVNLSLAH